MTPQRPDPIAHLTGSRSPNAYPPGIGLPGQVAKFDTGGAVQIWPGSTFVCHVTKESESYAGLVALQERIKRSEFARFFTFLPPPSFHMTVFQGYSPGVERTENWPTDLRADSTHEIAHRATGVTLPTPRVRTRDLFCLHSLTLDGATPEDEAHLRDTRDALHAATGIRRPNFDGYVFHVTLAYLVQWLSPKTAQEVVAFSDEIGNEFCRAYPEIDLDQCAFCAFESMHHFEPFSADGRSGTGRNDQ